MAQEAGHEIQKPVTKVAIKAEMQQYREKYGEEEWADEYFNNFRCNLPYGGGADFLSNRYMSQVAVGDKTFGKYYNSDQALLSKMSSLKLNQTPEEFFGEIDKVINKLGLDVKMIERLNLSGGGRHELHDYISPIYIELRMLGYSHYDLTV